MANEIRATGATGLTLYAVIRNASNQVWNGSAFEAYNASNYATYDVALTEQGATGRYAVSFPAGIVTAGLYYVDVRRQAGGSPAVSDLSLGEMEIVWDGNSETTLADVSSGGATLYGESGSVTFTYTVYDTNGTTPLPGVSVYVSADVAGTQRSQAKVTDSLGRVQFDLNPGTVYFWRSHPSRLFTTNPDTETVS